MFNSGTLYNAHHQGLTRVNDNYERHNKTDTVAIKRGKN